MIALFAIHVIKPFFAVVIGAEVEVAIDTDEAIPYRVFPFTPTRGEFLSASCPASRAGDRTFELLA